MEPFAGNLIHVVSITIESSLLFQLPCNPSHCHTDGFDTYDGTSIGENPESRTGVTFSSLHNMFHVVHLPECITYML